MKKKISLISTLMLGICLVLAFTNYRNINTVEAAKKKKPKVIVFQTAPYTVNEFDQIRFLLHNPFKSAKIDFKVHIFDIETQEVIITRDISLEPGTGISKIYPIPTPLDTRSLQVRVEARSIWDALNSAGLKKMRSLKLISIERVTDLSSGAYQNIPLSVNITIDVAG